MKKIIIAAMTPERVIGTKSGMPWSIPEEYNQYLNFIKDQTVIIGRKSWEIFGSDLTCKHTIIVSRTMRPSSKCDVYPSVAQAIAQAETLGLDIFFAGGSRIYEQTIHRVDWMYLSFIKEHHDGTSFFPLIDPDEWIVEEVCQHTRYELRKYRKAAILV